MITMNLQGKVRRLCYREGLTLSEIEHRTGLTQMRAQPAVALLLALLSRGAAPRGQRLPLSGWPS